MINLFKKSIALFLLANLNSCGAEKVVYDIASKCNGLTIENVKYQNSLTDDCRSAIMNLLDGYSTNLEKRLYTLGSESNDTSFNLYISGVKVDGSAVKISDFSGLSVSLINSDNTYTDLSKDLIAVSELDPTKTLAAFEFVSDYSGSMREADITMVNTIFSNLLECLPKKTEGEIIEFSNAVQIRQAFTDNINDLKSGFTLNKNLKRDSTALYDAIGLSAEHLKAKSKPIKILFVATDGLENSSIKYKSIDTVKAAIKESKGVPILLGSLFADAANLSDIAGTQGAFIYAKSLDLISSKAARICAIASPVSINIKGKYPSEQKFRVQAAGLLTK